MCQGGRGVSGGSGSLAFWSSEGWRLFQLRHTKTLPCAVPSQFWHQKPQGLHLAMRSPLRFLWLSEL